MGRSLSILAFVVMTLWGLGRAEARRAMVCEPEEDTSPRMVEDDRPAPAPLPVHDVCSPGNFDDPSCWPDMPLPERGPAFFFGSTESYSQVGRPSLPTCFAEAYRFTDTLVPPLAPGHARRLERPPRSA